MPHPAGPASLDSLTAREREVLTLIGRGLSNAEIAAQLVLGEGTVKTHVNHVFAKLHLRDRTAAVVFAFDSGLVIPRGGDWARASRCGSSAGPGAAPPSGPASKYSGADGISTSPSMTAPAASTLEAPRFSPSASSAGRRPRG